MCQLALRVNAALATRGQALGRRTSAWQQVWPRVLRTQARNRKAQASHHRRRVARLGRQGIDLASCRCCFLKEDG